MKVGDLVKVSDCGEGAWTVIRPCDCFFCRGKSNRIGVVTGVAPRNSWVVMFDCGEWHFDAFEVARGELEVIRARR